MPPKMNFAQIARPYTPGILLDYVRQASKEYDLQVKLYGVEDDRNRKRRTAVGIACRECLPNELERHALYAWLSGAQAPHGLAQVPDAIVFGIASLLGTRKDDLTGTWIRHQAAAAELVGAAKYAVQQYGQLPLVAEALDMGGVMSAQPPAVDPLPDIDW